MFNLKIFKIWQERLSLNEVLHNAQKLGSKIEDQTFQIIYPNDWDEEVSQKFCQFKMKSLRFNEIDCIMIQITDRSRENNYNKV